MRKSTRNVLITAFIAIITVRLFYIIYTYFILDFNSKAIVTGRTVTRYIQIIILFAAWIIAWICQRSKKDKKGK